MDLRFVKCIQWRKNSLGKGYFNLFSRPGLASVKIIKTWHSRDGNNAPLNFLRRHYYLEIVLITAICRDAMFYRLLMQ